jgi:hypothetical protein
MLLVNETKEKIREKFNILNQKQNINKLLPNDNSAYVGGKKKYDSAEIMDEVYSDEKYDYEDELNLPVDSDISKFLPDLNSLIERDYEHRNNDYEIKLELIKGYPKDIKPFKIVIYTINNTGVIPFLLFLFYKKNKSEGETFILPELSNTSIKKLIKEGNDTIKKISDLIILKLFTNLPKKMLPDYMGYKSYNDEYYLFYEYNPENITSVNDDTETSVAQKFNRKDNLIWTSVSEIVDDKKILNFMIESTSTDFFINNLDVITLYKDGGVLKHETPIIGYYGGHRATTNYTAVFGVSKRSTYATLGPYYYFASYETAMKYAIFSVSGKPFEIDGKYITIDDKGRFDKGGLVRFVVFTGKMKLYDDKGKADIINKVNIKKEPEFSWVDDYNSAFTGVFELKDESDKHKNIYISAKYAVKQYNQQVPLTYHYVNTDVEIKDNDFSNIFIE